MPAMRACHDSGITSRVELAVYSLYRCIKDFLFHLLAFAVLLIEFRREHCCFALRSNPVSSLVFNSAWQSLKTIPTLQRYSIPHCVSFGFTTATQLGNSDLG